MLGTSRLHQQNFNLFLAVVVGVSLLAAVVFVLTAPRAEMDSTTGAKEE